jgi:hypothetical protein
MVIVLPAKQGPSRPQWDDKFSRNQIKYFSAPTKLLTGNEWSSVEKLTRSVRRALRAPTPPLHHLLQRCSYY